MTDDGVSRAQTRAEIAHWSQAVAALDGLDLFAAPGAWSGLEDYMRLSLRERLLSIVRGLNLEAGQLQSAERSHVSPEVVRLRLLRLRERYLQVETVCDFFGDAIAQRSDPRLAAVLRGLDTIAADGLDAALRPLGISGVQALVYLDRGLGASVLRAGVRLWDESNPSPVAAIKITRHNLGHPTALCHELGHQAGHLSGFNLELANALGTALRPRSTELADAWQSWASEVAADVYAFALTGWAPVPALANVVDGTSSAVYRLLFGDPHPFPWIRVMFNIALCRSWYGPEHGPWDDLGRAWWERHPPESAPGLPGRLARESIAAMPEIVDICTRRPMRCFGGRPLTAFIDPRRVSPNELDAFASRAGESLLTSAYLQRQESLRILTWLVTRATAEPSAAPTYRQRLRDWLARLGAAQLAQTA